MNTQHQEIVAGLAKWGETEVRVHTFTRDYQSALTSAAGQHAHDIPPRTVVKLSLRPAMGSNVNVEMWLPDAPNWNGRFLGLGNGGAAGGITWWNFIEPVRQGYAVATTDMGTAPTPNSGIGNPEVWKDFGHRATHLMTVAAKIIIEAFYGQAPLYSYFVGSSTGGQQAMQEAQSFPEDYDGIFAGVPAHCRTPLHAYFLWNHQVLSRCPFTRDQELAVIAAGNQVVAPRELPEVAGQFISDPRCTPEEAEATIEGAMKRAPSLTSRHADALRLLFQGPLHAETGERIFGGVPLGAEFENARHNLYLFHWVFGADQDLLELNFGQDFDRYTAALAPDLNAENPNLNAFRARGGKLLILSGSADSIVPYHATLDYYERVAAHGGGLENIREFARFFLIPGKDHGQGPGVVPSVDVLRVIRSWREAGSAPEYLPCSRQVEEKDALEMPVYAYPCALKGDSLKNLKVIHGPRGGVESIPTRFLRPQGT